MTTPANLTERHYAEQALLAAVVAEHKARKAIVDDEDDAGWAAHDGAWHALRAAEQRYAVAVEATERTADPIVENIAEAGTFEIHDCPGGAYVIVDLSTEFQAALDRKIDHQIITGREPHDPDDQFDPADRYDSGYIATPAEAAGRAADEFYGRDA